MHIQVVHLESALMLDAKEAHIEQHRKALAAENHALKEQMDACYVVHERCLCSLSAFLHCTFTSDGWMFP